MLTGGSGAPPSILPIAVPGDSFGNVFWGLLSAQRAFWGGHPGRNSISCDAIVNPIGRIYCLSAEKTAGGCSFGLNPGTRVLCQTLARTLGTTPGRPAHLIVGEPFASWEIAVVVVKPDSKCAFRHLRHAPAYFPIKLAWGLRGIVGVCVNLPFLCFLFPYVLFVSSRSWFERDPPGYCPARSPCCSYQPAHGSAIADAQL